MTGLQPPFFRIRSLSRHHSILLSRRITVVTPKGDITGGPYTAVVTPARKHLILPEKMYQNVMINLHAKKGKTIVKCKYGDAIPHLGMPGSKYCHVMLRSSHRTWYERKNEIVLGMPFMYEYCLHLNDIDGTIAFSNPLRFNINDPKLDVPIVEKPDVVHVISPDETAIPAMSPRSLGKANSI
ncbi:unnamed protein product [Gongylonema pulchrum]|uniref:39S ribosomal protein L2, mitochondrial n=1 Tax=Gongylonema pulchrum TaxID=637853 RepID=A0A183ET20_9BILA|nr:unnamed protein product [Gongylonema pulchrum]